MITIHEDCKKKLKLEVKKFLDEVKISNYGIDVISFLNLGKIDDTFPTKIKEELQLYIKEDVLFTYLYSKVLDFILTSSALDNYSKKSGFDKLSNYVDTEDFSNTIINDLELLPNKGCMIMSLGKDIKQFVGKNIYEISDTLSLIWPDNNFKDEYPLYSGSKRKDMLIHDKSVLMTPETKEWSKDETYLKIDFEGYAGIQIVTEPMLKAIDMYKSFLGFLIAMETVTIGYTNSIKDKYYIYSYNNGWKIEKCKKFDNNISKTLNRLSYVKGLAQVFDLNKFIYSINLIALLMKKKRGVEKLLLAACWLFDSFCGENELLSFIQTTVSLEILLGDKETSDIMGLGALLRNRCAYLLGNSYKEREDIIKDFKEIYDIRSKIVHRGKSRLSKKEKVLFHKLQELAKRVIKKEIELIKK